jgi:DNA-binding response OmpR family regulator
MQGIGDAQSMTQRTLILYVDDEPDTRLIVEIVLKTQPDFDVRTAASGEEALQILRTRDGRPALLMISVAMPGLSGPDVLERVQADSRIADVPVVFVTAQARSKDVSAYLMQGVVDVFIKPFNSMTLAQDITALLQRL